jgi:hypothetical protein
MTTTSTEVQSPLTQDEKREVLKNDRRVREMTTFRSFADAFANETRGGRFAKSDTGPTIKPLPPNSPWASNPVPDEPPLGFDVNAVPDLGFPLNKQTSVVPTPAIPLAAVETATDERGGAASNPDSPAPTSDKGDGQ